jgi:hypothetical protein
MGQELHISDFFSFRNALFFTSVNIARSGCGSPFLLSVFRFSCDVVLYHFLSLLSSRPTSLFIIVFNLYRFIT